MRTLLIGALVVCGLWAIPTQAGSPSAPAFAEEGCRGLAELALANVVIHVAEVVPPGGFQIPESQRAVQPAVPPGLDDLPAFCRVAGVVDPRIQFEIWLPVEGWNGRFLVVGNGGLAGQIVYGGLAMGLRAGYATASTDTGHSGSALDGRWALGNPGLVADLGYRAIHETAARGKSIVEAFYGRAAHHSYFNGCSTGGRQGLMAAQRYPSDFDGIAAGAPAINWSLFHASQLWAAHATLLDPAAYLPPEHLRAVTDAVLQAWDGRDGVEDGVIQDPGAVQVDLDGLKRLLSLTDAQVEAIRRIYDGPRDARGQRVYFGFMPGSEYAWPALVRGPEAFPIGVDVYRYMVMEDPNWNWRNLDFGANVAMARAKLGPVMDASNPDLSEFRQRGGRLILWHGWNDPLIPPLGTVRYYEDVVEAAGGRKQADAFVRLFMLPGVEHCGGGPGADRFDPLQAVVDWVERNTAPDGLVVARVEAGRVVRTRPLCAYPAVARWTGQGSVDDAANFTCSAP